MIQTIGKSLRSWPHSQQMGSMEQFFEWEEHVIAVGTAQTSYKGNSWDNHTEYLIRNSIKNLHMLWMYLHHLANEAEESSFNDDTYSFMSLEEFQLITRRQFVQWRLEHSSQQAKFPNGNGSRGIPSKTPYNLVLGQCTLNALNHMKISLRQIKMV